MAFQLERSPLAAEQLAALERDAGLHRQLKAVSNALKKLMADPKHPSLNTHEMKGRECPHGGKLFEAYAQNDTPGAYRIFFCYPPDQRWWLYIIAITPHP